MTQRIDRGVPIRPVQMDEMEAHVRDLLAGEAVEHRCNGLARKIKAGHDDNPRTLIAISLIKKLLIAHAAGRLG